MLFFLGARHDDRSLPRLHGIFAIGLLSDSLQEMEEVFREERQQRDIEDAEQGKGDPRMEQVE